jgi:RHS repeat-associated protein
VKGAVTSNYTRMKSAFANIGQLTVVDSSSNAEDRGYKYDAAWNLSMRTNNMTLETYTVDGKNQVVSSPESSGHYYDGNGNPVYKDMAADYIYAFDQENRLIAIEFSYWYMLSCGYDGQGRLRTMTTWEWSWEFEDYVTGGTVSYIYDGMRVIQERYLDSNTPEVSYTRGTDLSGSLEGAGGIGGMLARSAHTGTARTNHTHAFYHADGNGNITYLQTSAQGLGASYRYDAYGNTVASSGSLAGANTYRFSSKMVEPFTGLYYYGYRWYAPNLQRWLSQDPLGENGHLILRVTSVLNLGGKSFGIIFDNRNNRRRDRQVTHLYTFGYNAPTIRIDLLGLDSPGCDLVLGDKHETPCALEACARHDECYRLNGCTAWSWLDTFRPCVNACKKCNMDAAGAILGCGLWDEGFDDPNEPNFYCAQCGEYFDVPGDRLNDPKTNPHFGHTTD